MRPRPVVVLAAAGAAIVVLSHSAGRTAGAWAAVERERRRMWADVLDDEAPAPTFPDPAA